MQLLTLRRPTTLAALLALAAALVLAPAAAAQPQPDLGSEEQVAAGKVVYDKWCGQCHGDDGAGEGIAAPHVLPKPRDFTSAKYKFRSTPFGALPTEEDLARSIRNGLPGTSMPAFPELTDTQVENVIHYLKTFAADWQDPAAYAEAVEMPSPPPYSEERAAEGKEAYVRIGCARCHGDEGRGDGSSAPTLRDDWGHFIRVADLTMPWTFRGGATREELFRTLTTGLYGTPMAAFGDALTEEERWAIVDWMVSKGGGEEGGNPYGRLVTAQPVEGEIVLAEDPAQVGAAFADAPATLLPIVGQVMEPGRAFRPGVRAVEVRAIFNRDEIAFLVSWNDMVAERSGENRPDLPVGIEDELDGPLGGWAKAGEGDDAADDGGEAAASDDPFASDEVPAADPFATDPFASDPFGAAGATDGAAPPPSPWSDAVALQFPIELRDGVAKPYFLFGDPAYPVELWHVDLADPGAAGLWEGRGSDAVTEVDREPPQVVAHYEAGRWSVAFKRPRAQQSGPAFAEDVFMPLAVTVWDGFHHERGNRRGLTSWYHVYVPPLERPSLVAPMLRAGLGVLGLELLVVALVRRRKRRSAEAQPES